MVTVLFHEVSDDPSRFHFNNNLNVTKQNFYNQLIFLKNNFNIISPLDLISKKFNTPAALITFDDGAKGFFNNAKPILEDLKIPCIHFLNMEPILGGLNINGLVSYLLDVDKKIFNYFNTKNINTRNITYNKIIKYLDNFDKSSIINKANEYHGPWASMEDLEKCNNSNLIFFGNHLFNHYNCLNLEKNELIFQFNENKKHLDKLKNSINFFSYPYGHPNIFYNHITNSILNELGVKYIFSAFPINYNLNNSVYHRLPIHDHVNTTNIFKKHILIAKLKGFIKKFYLKEYRIN